jgi:hypothetical protein
MDCILRVGGEKFNRDLFLKTSKWSVDISQKKGNTTSFNMLISSKKHFKDQLDESLCFLKNNADKLLLISQMGGDIELDFGITLEDEQFCKNCRINVEVMELAVKLGIEINISIYQ